MMQRFIIDNDGTNLFGRGPLTREDLRWTVEQLPPAVTTVMLCPNWIGKFFCPDIGEPASADRCAALHRAWAEGSDPFGGLLQRVRASGREAFVTYRMNDVHGAPDPDHPGASAFKRAHMDWTVDAAAVAERTGEWMRTRWRRSMRATSPRALSNTCYGRQDRRAAWG